MRLPILRSLAVFSSFFFIPYKLLEMFLFNPTACFHQGRFSIIVFLESGWYLEYHQYADCLALASPGTPMYIFVHIYRDIEYKYIYVM
jgi:hypothetical protein